jgi:hypothetical protein
LSLEIDVEVGNLTLEDIGQLFGVGDNAFDYGLVVGEGYLTDDGSERVVEQLNNFLGGIFLFLDEDMFSLSLLGATHNQRL